MDEEPKINVANFDKLINFHKRRPEYFSMEVWCRTTDRNTVATAPKLPPCGTALCMGGTAAFLMWKEGVIPGVVADFAKTIHGIPQGEIYEWLGISRETGRNLFFLKDKYATLYGDYSKITVEDAIAVLEEVKVSGRCERDTWELIAPHAVRDDYVED